MLNLKRLNITIDEEKHFLSTIRNLKQLDETKDKVVLICHDNNVLLLANGNYLGHAISLHCSTLEDFQRHVFYLTDISIDNGAWTLWTGDYDDQTTHQQLIFTTKENAIEHYENMTPPKSAYILYHFFPTVDHKLSSTHYIELC